jgi:hypothetical protein
MDFFVSICPIVLDDHASCATGKDFSAPASLSGIALAVGIATSLGFLGQCAIEALPGVGLERAQPLVLASSP